jgi:hypothetical protein
MDAANIAGMASILSNNQNNQNIDISKLESEIMQLHKFNTVSKDEDPMKYYRDSIADVSKDIGVDLESDNFGVKNSGIYRSSASGINKVSFSNSTPSYDSYRPNNQYSADSNHHDYSNDHEYVEKVTMEQQKQEIIDNVISDYQQVEPFDIEKTREEDEKDNLLEQIDSLIDILTDDNVNLSRVPRVDKNSSIEQIKSVLKWLTIKNDRLRFGTLADEIILAGCGALERLFDGKKMYFGTSPDLTGWSDTARVKLSRSRYTTSSIVGNVIQNSNIGPVTRLFIEFVPSIILYSNRRKEARIFDNNDYKNSINDLSI